jgi:serine/threonine-protein kinase
MEGKPPEEPGETPIQVKIAGKPAAAQSAAAAAAASEADKEFWNEVKDSEDPDELGLYLEQFPRGQFAEIARKKIADLGGK